MSHLKNKIALVTGATRGLGKGIAIGLGEAGATVYITGRSWDASEAKDDVSGSLLETKLAVEKAGGVCIPVQVDHKDDDQVESLFNKIEQEQKGQLDILVNNAFSGVKVLRDSNGQPFWENKTYLWDAVNNVGLRSHYITSMFAARMMTKRCQGLICTISSWGGISYIFGAAYGAGKASCDRLAADMAVELQPYNVASVSIWPGIVGTEHISHFADEMLAQDTTEAHNNIMSDQRKLALRDHFNWETPLLTGRVIAALAAESNVMKKTGKVQIVAELAQKYRLVEQNNQLPLSLRSLRFLLPFAIPQLRNYAWLIPDFKIPWFILLWTTLKSPQI
jgi:NAD(P)-dependent dehydrogenase (short-subunit alcohol dehydrogenase family)